MKPSITVVVPTRNRSHTIENTLDSCLNQQADFSVLVSDNQSIDDTSSVVRRYKDPRLRYVVSPEYFSMEKSWEFALEHVDDGYVMFLGADDALFPGAITTLLDVIEQTNASVIRPPLVSYYWDTYPDPSTSRIMMNVPVTPGPPKWADSSKILKRVAESLLDHNQFFGQLPALYHGCCKVSILKSFANKHGGVFLSKLPDMFSTVLLAAVEKRFLHLAQPISVNAMSGSSNAVAQFLQGHRTDPEGRKFWEQVDFPYEDALVTKSDDPNISFCIPILIADQFLKLKRLGYEVPDISFEQVISASVRGATRWHSREQYEGALTVAREMARIHKMEELVEREIRANPFKYRQRERRRTFFDSRSGSYRILDLAPLMVNGSHEATEKVAELIEVHSKQSQARTDASGHKAASNVKPSALSPEQLLLWLALRSFPESFSGRTLILADNLDRRLADAFLTPPSLVSDLLLTPNLSENGGCYDTIVLLPKGNKESDSTELKSRLSPSGRIIFMAEASNLVDGDCRTTVDSRTLRLTNEEHIALAFAFWRDEINLGILKRLLLAPFLRFTDWIFGKKLHNERHPLRPSGWILSVFTSNSRDKAS